MGVRWDRRVAADHDEGRIARRARRAGRPVETPEAVADRQPEARQPPPPSGVPWPVGHHRGVGECGDGARALQPDVEERAEAGGRGADVAQLPGRRGVACRHGHAHDARRKRPGTMIRCCAEIPDQSCVGRVAGASRRRAGAGAPCTDGSPAPCGRPSGPAGWRGGDAAAESGACGRPRLLPLGGHRGVRAARRRGLPGGAARVGHPGPLGAGRPRSRRPARPERPVRRPGWTWRRACPTSAPSRGPGGPRHCGR